jgi:photosynthetic reaction center cytochrome c subunit
MKPISKITSLALTIGLGVALAGCKEERITSKQEGYRGVGLVQSDYTSTLKKVQAANLPPEAVDPVEKSGTPASKTYQNVKVLGDLDENEFLRLMTAITAWVSPEQGCNYCHNPDNPAADDVYTKVVARRMIQMVQTINVNWTKHVAPSGVTCYTCHRGQPVPKYIWFSGPVADAHGFLGYSPWGKNHAGALVGGSSLPNDPFTTLLDQNNQIRVNSTTALPEKITLDTVQKTDVTYALMISMSKGLGVNCTFCHNTRQFADWSESAPQRATAWYGIRMVRDLNEHYLDPLKAVFPAKRLGPNGDGPKLYCATCHQGEPKPLNGANVIKGWPELASISPIVHP